MHSCLQAGNQTGCFRYNTRPGNASYWEPHDDQPLTPSPPIWMKHLQPNCLSLPQGIARFSMVVPANLLNNMGAMGLKVEVTLGTIAQPIRAVPSANNVQLDEMTNFDISAVFILNPLGGGLCVDHVKLEVDVDLNQAAPGLLVFNLWSSCFPASCLLTTSNALLLSQDLDHVLGDITDGTDEEDLPADLADILDASSASSRPTDIVYLSSLLDAASDILEWSRETGCVSLERLLLERTLSLQQHLATNKGVCHEVKQIAGCRISALSVNNPDGGGPEHVSGSALKCTPDFDAYEPTLKPSAPARMDRKHLHLFCWSIMQVIPRPIWKSMAKGKGETFDLVYPKGCLSSSEYLVS